MACLIQGSVVDRCVPQRLCRLPVLLALRQCGSTDSLGWTEEHRCCVQPSNPEGRHAVVTGKMIPASVHSRSILLFGFTQGTSAASLPISRSHQLHSALLFCCHFSCQLRKPQYRGGNNWDHVLLPQCLMQISQQCSF